MLRTYYITQIYWFTATANVFSSRLNPKHPYFVGVNRSFDLLHVFHKWARMRDIVELEIIVF